MAKEFILRSRTRPRSWNPRTRTRTWVRKEGQAAWIASRTRKSPRGHITRYL